MKAILMSIKPRHVCNILNGIKLWEIRKMFPKDFVGWVYIYCTKGNKHECLEYADNPDPNKEGKWVITSGFPYANGKVVARFWCDKVEEILFDLTEKEWFTDSCEEQELLKESCLSQEELDKYLGNKNGYAIHITKLEIFDKLKEINEFRKSGALSLEQLRELGLRYTEEMYKDMATKGKWFLTRAPQSWCYLEV